MSPPPPTVPLLCGWSVCAITTIVVGATVGMAVAVAVPVFIILGTSFAAIMGRQMYYEHQNGWQGIY